MTGDEVDEVEPEDADCEDAHPPPELLELGEVLKWQAALPADPPEPDPPKRSRKPKGDAS